MTRPNVVVAWALCGLSTLFFVLGVVFSPATTLFGRIDVVLISLGFFVLSFTGAAIITKRGNHLVAWLFCVSGVVFTAQSFAASLVERRHFGGMEAFPAEDFVTWFVTWPIFVAFGAAPLLTVFVFPNGRLTTRRWRPAVSASVVAIGLAVLGSALAPGPIQDFEYVDNPYGVGGTWGEFFGLLDALSWPLLGCVAFVAAASLITRFRRSHGDERQQIKWMLAAGLLFAMFIPTWGLLSAVGHEQIARNLGGFVLSTPGIAAGIAILRYRLYDIDVIINRALVYGSLTAALLGAYLLIVVALGRLLDPITRDSDVAVAASTLAVAALFRPLRARIQGFIDRRFYRGRYDAARALHDFSARLRNEVDIEVVRSDVIGVVGTTVQPRHASLWLREAR